MVTQVRETRKEKTARRAFARGALYRLLSQALVYPSPETLSDLRDSDMPQAQEAAPHLAAPVAGLLAALSELMQVSDVNQLQLEHTRVFSHILSKDCPPCESIYTAKHVFQETQDLSDIAGFYRAFGLEIGGKERLDHITVELEFMHFLTYKEAYAQTRHGPAKARLCREVQRKFMQDHLGRWAIQFAERLDKKANGGYFGCISTILKSFLESEVAFLRATMETEMAGLEWRNSAPEDFSCPVAEECLNPEAGGDDAH